MDNQEDDELNYGKEQPMIGWFKLYQFSPTLYKIYLAIGIVSAMISGTSMPLFIVFLADLYDSFDPETSPKETYDSTFRIGLYFIYIGAGLWVASYIYLAFFGMVSEYTGMIFRVKYLESVLKQDVSWFEDNDPQSLASKISKESLAIQTATGEKAANIIMAMTMSVAGFVIAFVVGWKFSLLCLGFIPFMIVMTMLLIIVLSLGYKQHEKAFKASSTNAEQALANIKIVAAYGQENKEEERFTRHLDEAKTSNIKFHFISALGYGLNNAGFLIIFSAALYFGGLFVTEGVHNDIQGRDYTPGDTIAIFFGVMFGASSLGIAAPNFKSLTRGRQAGYCALETIHRQPEILIDNPEAKPLDDFRGEIKFENVSFQYKTRKTKALKSVNITFERGKITALVGPSGSGKSTIVQLMERFYDPHEGQVLIDGQDLRSLNLRDFRSQVGYVSQEPVLFNQTIRENLLYGNPDATEEQMMKALANANASKIISRLPEGLDTIVGAQGGQLSGGEKQRIALARAFVKEPKVLILDEATSALDRKNEEEVQAAIDRFENGDFNITTIVIAHRLSTIRNSDKIVVLKEGNVVEEGDHKSLLKQHPNGVYATLVKKQEMLNEQEEQMSVVDSDEEPASNDERSKNMKHNPRKHSTDHRKASSFGEVVTNKKEEADKLDEDKAQEKEELEKQIKKRGFFKRLIGYNKPYSLILLGLLSSLVQGMAYPVFAIFYIKALFSMFRMDQGDVEFWSGFTCLVAFSSLVATYLQKLSFGILAENMTKEIRKDLYYALLRKHIGWYDLKENNTGVLTSVLSSDVYALNGASTEGLSTMIEASSGLIGAIILAFIFEWRTALCCIAIVPFFACAASIQTKLQTGFSEAQEGQLKEANLLISDAISNYKTVASFAHEYLLVDNLKALLAEPMKKGLCKSHLAGFVFGYSNFVQNISFGVLFFCSAIFIRWEGVDSEDSFITIFIVMFAAFGAGQAQQFGPSQGKALKSALRIFSIIDEQSEINVDDTHLEEVVANESNFTGRIEFKNIWFRYPTRPEAWVLKDLSLTIEPNEHIALVGESGSGKSTIVQLLYRFYEPHFGQILIDGVDIKHYNIVSLRQQMGLVQQMPTLFNESVLYNICYGQDEEDLDAAVKAAEISNANGFIAKLNEIEGGKIIEEHEEEDNVDIDDVRRGMSANCGVGGGKLSGGQKQRIAIARAVIRQPKLLLLDEATSALDEVSQGKVQEALEQVMQGRTSIVIAHRLTTIENSDRIVILKNGHIFKEGKFDEVKDEL